VKKQKYQLEVVVVVTATAHGGSASQWPMRDYQKRKTINWRWL